MSRTYRRKQYGFGKNKHPYPWWVREDFVYKGHIKNIRLHGPELKERINEFHSDKGVGDSWPVPGWFRRKKEKIRRAKIKAETKKILDIVQTGDYDIEDNYFPIKKNIQWEWW